MASYVKSILSSDVRSRLYILFTYALSSALLSSVISCGGLTSSGKNTNENKISLDLLQKMQMNQLTSTKGYKVAIKVKNGEDISDTIGSGDLRYKAISLVNAVFVDLDRQSILALAKDSRVEKVEENYDVKVNLLYATKQIGVRDNSIWGAGYNGATLGHTGNPSDKIRLAVVDTGIDDRHSDFCNYTLPVSPPLPTCTTSRIVKIVNCYQTPACIEGVVGSGIGLDDHGHGSHVSGIILGNGASCDETNNTASIELHGILTDVSGATRYFFPAQFNLSSTGDMSADMTWVSSATTGTSVAFQSKTDAEALNNNLLFTYTNQINSGPGVTTPAPNPSANFIQSSNYTEAVPAGTVMMPHAFVASTVDNNASGQEFWASVKTSVQGWGWGDAAPRLAGVSYGSELVAVKSLGSGGTGSVEDIVRALEYVSSIAAANNIVAVNLSFSIGSGITSEVLKAAVRGLVSNGVAVVDSAGNDQQQGLSISSPGDEASSLTVGAVNDQNQVTIYTSIGSLSSNVTKPDVLAPGGSFITRNYIMAPKSTYIDRYSGQSQWNRTNGATLDSYALKIGTSQSAPFVTGLIGVMASRKTGGWTFGSSTMPMFYKMLICMTAFETGSRESSAIFMEAPTMPERAGGIKDRVEGYGRIDARGAMSAIDDAVALSALPANTFSFGANVYDQKSFVRAVTLSSGEEYNFSMIVPPGADYDLYLFNGTPDANGEPVLLASSALVNNPVERIVDFIPPSTGTYYLVAKWISGSGQTNFALDSERTKPATATQISSFRLDRNMRDKIVSVSWKTNIPAISKIQYGSTGGLGSEKLETSYGTDHSFSFDINYNNYYYVRALSSSSGNTDLEISTAVSPVYRTNTYGVLQKDISVEDLPMIPNVGGCGTISDSNSNFNSVGFGAIIGFLPLILLVIIRRKLKFYTGR